MSWVRESGCACITTPKGCAVRVTTLALVPPSKQHEHERQDIDENRPTPGADRAGGIGGRGDHGDHQEGGGPCEVTPLWEPEPSRVRPRRDLRDHVVRGPAGRPG